MADIFETADTGVRVHINIQSFQLSSNILVSITLLGYLLAFEEVEESLETLPCSRKLDLVREAIINDLKTSKVG